MAFPEGEIEELKSLYGRVSEATESGVSFLLLPQLALPAGCVPERVDSLFCPEPRDGYPSRLFFAEKPRCHSSLNWNGQARILERNWFAFSWRINSPQPLRLAQTVQAHLRGLR